MDNFKTSQLGNDLDVKIKYMGQLKRLRQMPVSFVDLCRATKNAFVDVRGKQGLKLSQMKLSFSYIDDVGDDVTISNNEDLATALKIGRILLSSLTIKVTGAAWNPPQSQDFPLARGSYPSGKIPAFTPSAPGKVYNKLAQPPT